MKNKTLVFGASLNPVRYSNMAINKLVNNGEKVVAFGLKSGEVAGVKIDTELKKYTDIETVSLYMNPKRQADFYDYIVSLKPDRVIFNPGTENPEFYQILRKNSIETEEACTLVLLSTNQYKAHKGEETV
ncbi:CoA-binding protein [Abyssalbus ytuae]|uniref:CoA-binding protein n=1 Tax=Abyssalbus ytuae TaxID=2926907 RepID=A0A9E6ZZV5_9FLAO|nr:CoA-binding protein [Abyssalbus ytuae]UOB16971.1 CoA-binding protein [Abyssalbus ytuae]